jgi:hypothetical protein
MRALASLDPQANLGNRWIPPTITDEALVEADDATKKWLSLAFSLDKSARLLIEHALRQAAESAADKSRTWVEAAAAADLDVYPEGLVVRFLQRGTKDIASHPDEALRMVRQERLDKLEAFISMATSVADELREELGTTSTLEDDVGSTDQAPTDEGA